jgi:hypothetical protein
VQLLVGLVQLVIALVLSGAVAVLVGPAYVAVAALVLATCMVLLLDAAKQRSVTTEKPISVIDVAHIAGSAVVFGLIWPAIPLIFTWKRVVDVDVGDE